MSTAPYEVRLVGPEDKLFTQAEEVEAAVFLRAFGNTQELLNAEYDKYRQASEFFIVIDQANGQIAGVERIIRHSDASFKSLDDLAKEPWNIEPEEVLRRAGLTIDPEKTIDIATIGVAEGYRAMDLPDHDDSVRMALLYATNRYSAEHGIKLWFSILDDKVLELIQALGEPFSKYPGIKSGSYLDSPSSTPVYCDFTSVLERVRVTEPALYSMMILGQGMSSIVSAPELFAS